MWQVILSIRQVSRVAALLVGLIILSVLAPATSAHELGHPHSDDPTSTFRVKVSIVRADFERLGEPAVSAQFAAKTYIAADYSRPSAPGHDCTCHFGCCCCTVMGACSMGVAMLSSEWGGPLTTVSRTAPFAVALPTSILIAPSDPPPRASI